MTIPLNPLLPSWLTWLLTAALVAALVHGTLTLLRKQVAPRLVGILAAIRLAILGVFLLILLQPVFTFTSQVAQLPELLILVDTSSSMGRSSGAGENTRLQEITSMLQKGAMAEALTNRHQVRWFAFDSAATQLEEAELATLKPGKVSAQYAASIAAACDHIRAVGKSPQRLLLVSDGNDRGQHDPVEIARRYGVIVDVLAPTPGKSELVPAVEIAEVQSARRVLLGSDTHFRVTFACPEPRAAQSLLLSITEDGKKIIEQPLVFKEGRTEQTLLLTHRPASSGLKQYVFRLATNDRAKPYPLAVQVLDNKYEVLILEDRWRWEYKYLHRLFEDDPSFRFTSLLARGGGAFVQLGSPDRRVNLIGFPQNRADLESFDTFVLGDTNPALWPRGLAADLARQIADEGKSLVVVAGPGLANLLEMPALHAILPVELTPESGKPVDGPIAVRLRPDSGNSPFFFQLRSSDAEKLPPLDQVYPALRKRPGATVLLEAVKERNPYGNLIVIAEHTVGRGRVLFLGTDTLWKWHTLAAADDGPTPYSIFWQQAFRAMTPARSNIGAVHLWLTPSRSRIEAGRSVVVQAEVQSARTLPAVNLQGVVTGPDDKRLPLVFTVDPANPRLFRTEFSCQQPGLQRIAATVQSEGNMLAEASTIFQVDEPDRNRDDGKVDLANLARIAQATGGSILDPARSETWPAPPEGELPRIQQTHTIDLWNNFTLLLLLCVLLGADWFIRLFKGVALHGE